jgi:hypothetical protein
LEFIWLDVELPLFSGSAKFDPYHAECEDEQAPEIKDLWQRVRRVVRTLFSSFSIECSMDIYISSPAEEGEFHDSLKWHIVRIKRRAII